jgi:hypothetical protein
MVQDLCFGWTGMPAFHNFFPFFLGGFAVSEEEDEEQCQIETTRFALG